MTSKYTNLIFFILLTSLPLLFFMIYYEQILEQTLLESINLLPPPSDDYDYFQIQTKSLNSITPEFSSKLIFLCFLHLVPLHLLELLSAISTIYLTSKMHKQEPFTFKEVFKASWLSKGRLKGVLVTSIYVLSMSTCVLFGFLWDSIQFYTLDTRDLEMRSIRIPMVFNTIILIVSYPITILLLLFKFPEISAIWNTSLVVSIMEEVDGMRAFSLSFYFNKGSERRGLFIMFVFFGLGLGLRIPCLLEGGQVGFVARTGLLWVLQLVKWVTCTWYYFGCKNRVLQKKADLEVGGKFEGESLKNVT